ncbi:MAG: response regulator, partial [Gemmatimonadaceae bacterium]|nr:response regulator [Gloeobacterales cyanobacterium ES-bin-141]
RYLLESLGSQLAVALLNSQVFQEINEVRARLEATFEQMSDGVVIGTPDARPLIVNLAGRRILGLEPEQDLASVDWVEQAQIYSVEGEPIAPEDQPYQRAVRYNATVRSDLQLHIRGGRVVLVSVSASPIKDSEGQVSGVVAVFRDVTIERERERRLSEQAGELEALNQELTATNEELEMQRSELEVTNEELESQRAQIETQNQDLLEADRQKNNFLASMSHELRTPLNSILGFSQLLLRNKSLQGQEQILTQLERIYQNGKIQLRLVNDILDLAKIKAGKVELQYTRVAIEPLIRETLASVESLATQKGLAVRIEIDPALEMVETDPYQFSTILSNLLSNAFKYTERGGVEILARSVSAQLFEVVVRDSGVGIAPEEQSTVFDEFRRLEGAATRRAGGTGLGLTICKRLVSLLGGQISLKSTLGQGSTFTVLLPSLIQQATVSVPASANLKVLVIEDDPQVQQLIATRLIDQPYQLMFAPDSIEGIQIARNEQPDVIVLDTILPRTDLWKVLFELRTDTATATIPVILQSVQGERGLSIPLGLADFLNRPVGQESLLAVLRRRRIAPEGEAILIIDDNADGREYLAACLRDEGYTVELAASGLEALTYLEAHRPQLVILDLMMPQMDGFEVLRRLRLLPSGQNLPVLILSALDLSEEQRQTLLAQQTEQILKKGDQTIDELIIHLNATLSELRKHSNGQVA